MRNALLALVLLSTVATAQPRDGMSREASDAFSRWMTTTCIGDEADRWTAILLRYRAELAPAFKRALVVGPPEELVTRVRRAADARYAAVATAPAAQARIAGIAPRALARPARRDYVDGEAARFVEGYKSNAIAGLAIVGGPGTRAMLRRLADQRGTPLALAAAHALASPALR